MIYHNPDECLRCSEYGVDAIHKIRRPMTILVLLTEKEVRWQRQNIYPGDWPLNPYRDSDKS